MLQTYNLIKEAIPEFNVHCVTADRIFSIVEERRIEMIEKKQVKPGYHVWDEGEDYIFIKITLNGLKWLEAAMHELIHAIAQVPLDFMHRKQQLEARALSIIALIPLPLLKDKWAFLEENPSKYARQLWNEREQILFLYGV